MESRPLDPEQQADERPPFWKRFATATFVLALLCVLWTVQIPWSGKNFLDSRALDAAGAIQPASLWAHEFWRLATAIFLHGGWIHLAINVLSLFFVGSVIEKGCGRGTYLFFLFATAEAGVVASLLWNSEPGWRMGISGGLAGLIGLVLAMEWGVTKSIKEFLKQRNTILVMVLLAINVAISYYVETIQGARIDHAGHIGGFACGLIGGLASYPRSRVHIGRGVAVTLLLLLPSLAYATHSFRNPRFYRFHFRQALRSGDEKKQIAALRSLLGLIPGDVAASIRLALLDDDPEPLEALAPERAEDANRVAATWLELAGRRMDEQPDTARAYADRAAEVLNAAIPQQWLQFGSRAEQAEQATLAAFAFREAYEASQVLGRGTAHWRPAWAMLDSVAREAGETIDDPTLLRLLALAREAAPGLSQTQGEPRTALEQRLLTIGAATIGRARAAEEEAKRDLARLLSELFAAIASHTPEDDPKIAQYDLQMAVWWWVAAEDKDDAETREMGAGRFEVAWQSAHRTKNATVEAFTAEWFRKRGIPLPTPELAEEEEGG